MLPHPCFFARKDKERKRQIDEEERKKSRGKANSRILQFLKDEASFSPSARLTFFCFRSRRLALLHLPFLFELPLSISENQDRRARPSEPFTSSLSSWLAFRSADLALSSPIAPKAAADSCLTISEGSLSVASMRYGTADLRPICPREKAHS